MKANVKRECEDLVSDITDFVEEVRREQGEGEGHEFVDRLIERISE